MNLPRRGEVWRAESPVFGRRPVVVLTRDRAIEALRRPMVAPCTTTVRGLPSEVVLEPGDDPVNEVSVINLDSVEAVETGLLVDRLGVLSSARMDEVCAALAVATGCE